MAVVTGAGSGLGREITRALLTAGWQVALAGRREEALRETAALDWPGPPAAVLDLPGPPAAVLDLPGPPAAAAAWPASASLVAPTDVTSADSVAALFDAVHGRWGRLDLLVNNAGISAPPGDVAETSLADWQRVVDTNLTGAFLCAQHAVRLMKAQTPRGGRIINNGSISAYTPRPGSAAYTATKHAIAGLTKSISLDGRRHDIACGQIDIGNAATDLAKGFGEGVPQANGTVMAEPTFDPKHVADAVLYMASLPLDTNVQFLTITATKMPFIGRG